MAVPTMGTYASRKRQEKDDEVIDFAVRVRKATIISNDHNHADELKVTLDGMEAGCDPRLLRNATCEFYLGNANERGEWSAGADNLRFVGIARDVTRRADKEAPLEVDIDFLDYTTLFLEAKPFGTRGVPNYSQNLAQAWATIVSQTPGADVLATKIKFSEDLAGSIPVLGKAVAKRFAKLGKVPIKANTDAWAVWQQCVGMCGCISYILGDTCIVTSATDYYSRDDPPRLIWGKNIDSHSESRNPFKGNGIGLTSYSPLTGSTIEAVWPPEGDPRVKRKTVKAKKKQSEDAVRQAEEREWFEYNGVTDVGVLTDIAERVWEERRRQELEGTVTTQEMFVDTVSAKSADLIALRTGEAVRIELDANERQSLASLPSETERVAFLRAKGYQDSVAQLIARNSGDLPLLNPTFHAKTVTTTFEVDDDSGDFTMSINYINQISVTGDAVAITGAPVA